MSLTFCRKNLCALRIRLFPSLSIFRSVGRLRSRRRTVENGLAKISVRGEEMMSRRYRIALAGCGGMGRQHIQALHDVPDFSVVALCDVSEKLGACWRDG